MANCNSVTELSKKISVLDAIRWISSAVQNIKNDCVIKCFKHAGFEFGEEREETVEVQENELEIEETPEQDIQEIQVLIEELGDNSTMAENYIQIDEQVTTEGGYQTLDDLLEAASENQEYQDEEDEGQGLGKN